MRCYRNCSPRGAPNETPAGGGGIGPGGVPLPGPGAAPVVRAAADGAGLPRVPALPPLQDPQPPHALLLPVDRARRQAACPPHTPG